MINFEYTFYIRYFELILNYGTGQISKSEIIELGMFDLRDEKEFDDRSSVKRSHAVSVPVADKLPQKVCNGRVNNCFTFSTLMPISLFLFVFFSP